MSIQLVAPQLLKLISPPPWPLKTNGTNGGGTEVEFPDTSTLFAWCTGTAMPYSISDGSKLSLRTSLHSSTAAGLLLLMGSVFLTLIVAGTAASVLPLGTFAVQGKCFPGPGADALTYLPAFPSHAGEDSAQPWIIDVCLLRRTLNLHAQALPESCWEILPWRHRILPSLDFGSYPVCPDQSLMPSLSGCCTARLRYPPEQP